MNAKFRAGWSESQMLPIRTTRVRRTLYTNGILSSYIQYSILLTHQVIAPVRPEQGLKMKVKFLR